MRMNLTSSLIFTAVGVTLPIAAHTADMNDTHIYNPKWPPHAKFHDGQTLSLSILLGGLTTFLAWKSSRNVPMMVAFTGAVASLYFVSQDAANLYPGACCSDSEIKPTVLGIPAVHAIDGVYLAAVGAATWLGLRHRRADAAKSSL